MADFLDVASLLLTIEKEHYDIRHHILKYNKLNMTESGVPPVSQSQKVVNRCTECNKRVGLTGFKCRCDHLFCSSHRLPEDHCCTYDFKSAGKEQLIKDNPLVQPAKLLKV